MGLFDVAPEVMHAADQVAKGEKIVREHWVDGLREIVPVHDYRRSIAEMVFVLVFDGGERHEIAMRASDLVGRFPNTTVEREIAEAVLAYSPVRREAKRVKWMKAVQLVRARKCGRRTW